MKDLRKFLGVFVIVLALILCVPNSVKAEEVMSDDFKSYLNENLELEIKASFPTSEKDFMIKIIAYMFENHALEQNVSLEDYSDDFTTLDLVINFGEENEETHTVKIKYLYNEELNTKINGLISEEERTVGKFVLNDLDMLHYYYFRNKYDKIEVEQVPMYLVNSFSSRLKSVVDNKNIILRSLLIYGAEQHGLVGQQVADISWYEYDDTVYATYEQLVLFDIDHIFYVPSDTPNNADDVKNAAQKRINDYLQNENVKLTYISTAREYLQNSNYETIEEAFRREYDLEDISESDYVYKVEMEIDEDLTCTFDIIIKRDSSKMITTSKNVDFMTGIEVHTDVPISPDATISVSELTSGSEYDRIIRLLNLTDSVTYDIKLYSKTLGKNITKLDDGTFEVKIPIPENLKGKVLAAYYVDEDGKIEEYEVTIKDGYAIFKTPHFSIYTLGNAKLTNNPNDDGMNVSEENPQTFDNVLLYVIFGIISLVGLGVSGIILIEKNKHIKVR